MTSLGSVRPLRGKEMKDVTTGRGENGASLTSYITPFSRVLRDRVTSARYSQSHTGGRFMSPHLAGNGFLCFDAEKASVSEAHNTELYFYPKMSTLYKLYKRLVSCRVLSVMNTITVGQV